MELNKENMSKHGHLAATTFRKTFCGNTNPSVCAILKINSEKVAI